MFSIEVEEVFGALPMIWPLALTADHEDTTLTMAAVFAQSGV